MTSYPVYDVTRHDFTRECEPIGSASSEDEALTLLTKHFAGTEAEIPTKVELNDRDVGRDQIWAYWPVYDAR
jgi:hypothetical protein